VYQFGHGLHYADFALKWADGERGAAGVRLSLSVVQAAVSSSSKDGLRAYASRLQVRLYNTDALLTSDRVVLLFLVPPKLADGSQPLRQLGG
jgi:hypothetical protein